MVSAVLLTLAFAPISQFYLAWVGLVPWLMYVRAAATLRRLFLWNWAAGAVFFGLNVWWLSFVTLPGMLGSAAYMGLYWALAALVVRALGSEDRASRIEDRQGPESGRAILYLLSSILAPFAIAAIWTGFEWLRGNIGTGWPWSFLGYTQTPVLAMCQVADLAGVYGVTFWVVAINACVAQFVRERLRVRPVLWPTAAVAAMLLAVLAYGIMRIAETRTTPGPRVLVVQSNFPQSNTGEKGASRTELVEFHVRTTAEALAAARGAETKVELVVWSETMMPHLNAAARNFYRDYAPDGLHQQTYQALASLCFDFGVALLTGGEYAGKVIVRDDVFIDLDRRNTAYFFEPTGVMSDLRYDKVHLVPFGEYVPFKETIPPLYRFFMWFSPYDFDYNLVPGKWDALTVFTLKDAWRQPSTGPATAPATIPTTGEHTPDEGVTEGYRFVVPICFEDADPRLLGAMFNGGWNKRADFIVNITNDGWFSQPQLSQHLQMARFRSIENRVPTARSVNTGISAFIDSVGRVIDRLPAQVEGTLTAVLPLDARYTFYTQDGDFFAIGCVLVTGVVAVWSWIAALRRARSLAPEKKDTP